MASILSIETTYPLSDYTFLKLIEKIRRGIKYFSFNLIVKQSPFSIQQWAGFLHVSERTLQRYKSEKKAFDPLVSERIVEISLLLNKGVDVFGDKEKLHTWLNTQNIAMGNIKPLDLMDNSMGLKLISDELIRIEHGILA